MRILFCDSVLDRKVVEPIYEKEFLAAQAAGIATDLISHEALVEEGNVRKSISLVKPSSEKETGIYRGWMMSVEDYATFYEALLLKNIELINSPEAYRNGHHFPASYELIRAHTPFSVVVPKDHMHDETSLQAAISQINGAAIVKDYVKSLKHYWEEACFIPDTSDWATAKKIIDRFIKLQGPSLTGGLVLREYVPLRKLADHSKSGMPLSEEYRVFWSKGEAMQVIPYWEEGEYGNSIELPDEIIEVGKQIQSNFFTMDLARLESGGWTLMELGDGQVAGLPDQTNIDRFYTELKSSIHEAPHR